MDKPAINNAIFFLTRKGGVNLSGDEVPMFAQAVVELKRLFAEPELATTVPSEEETKLLEALAAARIKAAAKEKGPEGPAEPGKPGEPTVLRPV